MAPDLQDRSRTRSCPIRPRTLAETTSSSIRWLAFPASVLASLAVGACGGSLDGASSTAHAGPKATTAIRAAAASERPLKDSDPDHDASGPNDDGAVLYYGHPADATDARAVDALVKRYYAAAAAGDMARACAMLSTAAAEVASEEYEERSGRDLHGHACPHGLSTLLAPHHRELVADLPKLRVTSVRIQESSGLAILRLASTPEPRELTVRREGGAWRIRDQLDQGLP